MFRSVLPLLLVLFAVSACVTAPAPRTELAPLRESKSAETKSANVETAEPAVIETAPASEETLADDEANALPEEETLVLSAIIPPVPETVTPPAPPPPPEFDPSSLIGEGRALLKAKLGEPVLRRREGTAEVWQYRMQHCIVDFVLPDGQTVTVFQARHRQRGMTYDADLCRQDMAQLAGL